MFFHGALLEPVVLIIKHKIISFSRFKNMWGTKLVAVFVKFTFTTFSVCIPFLCQYKFRYLFWD